MDIGHTPAARLSRIWRFGDVEFDEGSLELRVSGAVIAMEPKPLALLQALLHLDGDVATKDELIAALWPAGVFVGDGSLTNAVSKLRAALGDNDRAIIRPVPKVGYKFGVPVECVRVPNARPAQVPTLFEPGDSVPGRPRWQLVQPMGLSEANRWLAQHLDTGDRRVFRFANDAEHLGELKREVLLSARLHGSGQRAGFVRVFEHDFETRPYSIESSFDGNHLCAWASSGTGLASTNLAERLSLAARIAKIVADAHQIGVVHGALSPRNILVAEGSMPIGVCVTGFAVDTSADADAATRLTVAGDIRALGRLLFGLAAGDLDRDPLPGWEVGVASPLLVEDIAKALSAGSPGGLCSAMDLAERLETFDDRAQALAAAHAKAEAFARLQQRLNRERERRPWIVVAGICLVAGLLATSAETVVARREAAEAKRAAAVAESTRRFVSDDLLAANIPGGRSSAQLAVDTISAADGQVDARFADDKALAGAIHLSLADTLALRSMSGNARRAYQLAIADFAAAGVPGADSLVIARARAALAEAQSLDAGSIDRARQLLHAAQNGFSATSSRRIEARIDLLAADGMISWLAGDPKMTHALFTQASELASHHADAVDADQRMTLKRLVAASLIRMGQWDEAEPILRDLLSRDLAFESPGHPETLMARLNLAQVMMLQGRSTEAIDAFEALKPQFIDAFGPTHRLTLELIEQHANTLEQMGRYDEAIRDDQQLYQAAISKSGARSYLAAGILSDLADVECRDGRTNDGIAASQQAYAISQVAMGEASGATQALRSTAVFCLGVGKHYAMALSLLSGLNQKASSDFMDDPTVPAEMDLVRAAAAFASGDHTRAQALLAEPMRIFLLPNADPFDKRWTQNLFTASADSSAAQSVSR